MAQMQLFEREKEKRQLEIQIKTLLRLENDDLIKYAAGLNLPDSGVAALYEQYQAAKQGISAMQATGLGERHPQIVMAQVSLSKLEEDLRASVVVLREILETQLNLVDGQLEKLNEVLENR